jgi:hypothetical protein
MHRVKVSDGEPEGWHGLFRPLRHYVPSKTDRFLFHGDLVAFAFPCRSPCTPVAAISAELPWCPECRRYLDWMWPPAAPPG